MDASFTGNPDFEGSDVQTGTERNSLELRKIVISALTKLG